MLAFIKGVSHTEVTVHVPEYGFFLNFEEGLGKCDWSKRFWVGVVCLPWLCNKNPSGFLPQAGDVLEFMTVFEKFLKGPADVVPCLLDNDWL